MTVSPLTSLRMDRTAWALLLLLSAIWGASFVFGRIAVQELPPFTVAWVRVGLAAAVLLAVSMVAGYALPRTLQGWAPFAMMGLLNNVVPFSLIFWGQQEIGAGLASVLNATTPMFAGIVAHLATSDDKLTGNRIAGILIGIAGVAVLVGPAALTGIGDNVFAQLAVLGAALSYAMSGIWGRRLRGTPPLVSACSQLLCSTAMLTIIVALVDQPWRQPLPSWPVIGALVGIAILCTAIAYIIFFSIIARAGTSNVMLVTLLIPPFAMLFGAVVLGERLGLEAVWGATIIGLALLVIDGRAVEWTGRRLGWVA